MTPSPRASATRWPRRQTEYFERLIPEVSATEGAADLLSLLRERGLRVVIASSGEPHITSRLLELVDGAPGLVHRIDGGSVTARSKPAPDLLLAAVESVGGTDAIVIGDSVWDTRAAQAAGLPCLAVRTGGFDDAELMANGATAVYENPGELLKAPELWADPRRLGYPRSAPECHYPEQAHELEVRPWRDASVCLATLAAGGLVLAGLAAVTPGAAAAAPQAKWTVMVYMSGDNNLEDYIVKDLELELGGRRLERRRPDRRAGRPRPGLRQEPRRLADDQAVPPRRA